VHTDNVAYHDSSYNGFFTDLVYESVCDSIGSKLPQTQNCSSYLGGILEKGLYSANLAFWNNIREVRDAFFLSNRSAGYISSLLNSPNLIAIEQLNQIYFATAYQSLLDT